MASRRFSLFARSGPPPPGAPPAPEDAARGPGAELCACGAPIVRGAHFCSHCGRPANETPPVVACAHCGQPLPADVNFCSVCGNAVAAEVYGGEHDLIEATMVTPAPAAVEPERGA